MTRKLALAAAALLIIAGSSWAQPDRQARARADIRRAELLERAGRPADALSVLAGVLEYSPSEPGAILAVERIYRRQGKLEEVLPLVELAIEHDPSSVIVRQIELRVLSDLGRDAELRGAGERWLRLAPRSEVAYREYAAVLRKIGAQDEAEEVLGRGRREIDRPAALAPQLADLYIEQGRWSEAAAEWLAVVDANPGMGWEMLNFKLESLGSGARFAAEALLEALADRGSSAVTLKLAAVAALYAGRFDQARERADAALDLMDAAERQQFVTRFARIAATRSRPELVAWSYRALLPDVTDESMRWELARQIVQHDLSAGDTAAALELLDDFLAVADAGGASHRWASGTQIRLYAARSDAKRAERALERHAGLYGDDPEFPQLALAVGEAYIRSGRLEDAKRVLNLVPAVRENSALAAHMSAARGYLALYAGEYDEARSKFEVAAASLTGVERSEALRFLKFLRGANDSELRAAAAAHRALLAGRRRDAFERLAGGLREAPGSEARPALLLWAGELAIEAGSIDRAEESLRRIPEFYPSSGEAPVALMTLADALAGVGRRQEALELLEALVIDYPESALTPLGRRRLAELREEVPRS